MSIFGAFFILFSRKNRTQFGILFFIYFLADALFTVVGKLSESYLSI